MNTDFTISAREVANCLEFAASFVSGGKSDLDFGNTSLPRVLVDRIADCTEGKIGEIGAMKLLYQFGVEAEVDFQIRSGRHNIDYGQDIHEVRINGDPATIVPRIDVKTSRSYSRWLLLEDHKIWSSALIFFTVELPRDTEVNLSYFENDVKCTFKGFSYWFDFFDVNQQPWFLFKQGQRLLSVDSVKKFYEHAKQEHGLVNRREQLEKSYRQLFGSSINCVGPPLKCPRQIGLPDIFLRKRPEEVKELARILTASGIPNDSAGQLIEH